MGVFKQNGCCLVANTFDAEKILIAFTFSYTIGELTYEVI